MKTGTTVKEKMMEMEKSEISQMRGKQVQNGDQYGSSDGEGNEIKFKTTLIL